MVVGEVSGARRKTAPTSKINLFRAIMGGDDTDWRNDSPPAAKLADFGRTRQESRNLAPSRPQLLRVQPGQHRRHEQAILPHQLVIEVDLAAAVRAASA